MNPCELNVLVTAITNTLYCSLTKEEYKCLAIVFNELSKTMFAVSSYEAICKPRDRRRHKDDG